MTTGQSRKIKYGLAELERDYGPLTFGALLRSHRQGEELSQTAFAKHLGISKQRLCDFEKGRRLPSLRTAYDFGKKLNLHPESWVVVVIEELLRKENLKMRVSLRAG